MPEPTPVSIRLARIVAENTPALSSNLEQEIENAALALDDAGVREAVEALEWITTQSAGHLAYRKYAAKALAALTGTRELAG